MAVVMNMVVAEEIHLLAILLLAEEVGATIGLLGATRITMLEEVVVVDSNLAVMEEVAAIIRRIMVNLDTLQLVVVAVAVILIILQLLEDLPQRSVLGAVEEVQAQMEVQENILAGVAAVAVMEHQEVMEQMVE